VGGVNKRGICNATKMCPPLGNTDFDISTRLKIFDILLKTEESAALLLYSANELSCRLPFAI